MNFTDIFFIAVWLPLLISVYYTVLPKLKPVILISASLLFYAMCAPQYFPALLISIAINVFLSGMISKTRKKHNALAVLFMVTGVLFNIGCLAFYKYLNFGIQNLNLLFNSSIEMVNIALPLGISFYSFKAISYLVEMHRGTVDYRPVDGMLYLCFFPQIQSGPISRISDFSNSTGKITWNFQKFSCGVHRFLIGYVKKILISNILVLMTDEIFGMDYAGMSGTIAWLGAIGYSLQLYFDFSSYSDMAIGLTNMFGYDCPENFSYPYLSKSFSEFWRRWHISLGAWFRDYVYIPLGGSRVSKLRLIFNLFAVWILTGIWHGSTWGYVFWGLTYFALIAFEKLTGYPKRMKSKTGRTFYRIGVLVIVNFLWVVFRIGDLKGGFMYWRSMFFAVSNPVADMRAWTLLRENAVILISAVILCTPLFPWIKKRLGKFVAVDLISAVVVIILFVIAISLVVAGQNNPFLYANF